MTALETLVIHHFDAYQKSIQDNTSSKKRGGVTDGSIEARVALLRKELFSLINKNNNNDDDDDDSLEEHHDLNSSIHQVTAAILQCVDTAMATEISKDSQDSIEKLLDLAACVAATHSHLAQALVARAVQFSGVIMERVRVQACKLLGLCVKYLMNTEQQQGINGLDFLDSGTNDNDNMECKQECIQVASKAIRSRLTDKSQTVRNAAICACASFFVDGKDVEDTHLVESLLWNMAHDPSAANRISAIQSVPITDDTVDLVIDRVRDVKVKVRVEALNTLCSKASVNVLKPEHRAELIRSGLTDRCKATCEAATRMICSKWLKTVGYDPIALLGILNPVDNEAECIKVARVILDVASEAEGSNCPTVLVELSDPEIRAFKEGVSNTTALLRTSADTYLEPRAVLFARVKCDQTNASDKSEALKEKIISKIVPDIPVLCEALQTHISRLVEVIQESSDGEDTEAMENEDVFVCSQLLQMAQATDLKEEGSRRHFISAMKNLLEAIETPDDLLEGCIKAMKFAYEKESTFLQTISDLISHLSSLHVNDSQSIMDEVIQLRIISILAITLENTSARMANDSTIAGFSSHIVPAVTSRHALVREGGVSCLGRLAILSDETTVLEEFKPLLLNVASNKDEKLEIRAQAMMAICDLSFLFKEMLSTSANESNDVAFVPLLSELLHTSKPAVAAVAAEIASKLLFAGRTSDCNLIADLVVTYFDQDIASLAKDEEDDATEIGSPVRMQQLLSLFFPAYGMRSSECRAALVTSIEPMLTAVSIKFNKKGTKVSDWHMGRMVEYVESLLEMTTMSSDAAEESSSTNENADDVTTQDENKPASPQEPSYGTLVAIQVSQFLLKEHSSLKTTVLRQLCKTLSTTNIDVDAADSSTLAKLKKNMDELGHCVTDSTCLRSLKPMADLLDSLKLDDEGEDDDNESTETEVDSDAESLAEALEAIAVAERSSMEIVEKENEREQEISLEDSKASASKSTSSRSSRRRLASMN